MWLHSDSDTDIRNRLLLGVPPVFSRAWSSSPNMQRSGIQSLTSIPYGSNSKGDIANWVLSISWTHSRPHHIRKEMIPKAARKILPCLFSASLKILYRQTLISIGRLRPVEKVENQTSLVLNPPGWKFLNENWNDIIQWKVTISLATKILRNECIFEIINFFNQKSKQNAISIY